MGTTWSGDWARRAARVAGVAALASLSSPWGVVSPRDPAPDPDFYTHSSSSRYRPPDTFQLTELPTLREAIVFSWPYMLDEEGGPFVHDPRTGAHLLHRWAGLHMSWFMVDRRVDIPLSLLVRHTRAYRGTLVCTRGTLRKIESSRAVLELSELERPRWRAVVDLAHVDRSLPMGTDVRACGVPTAYIRWPGGGESVEMVGLLDTLETRLWNPPRGFRKADMDGSQPMGESFGATQYL